MKAIINKKMYNTKTATCLGVYQNTGYQSDFQYFCEKLYRKKNGEFFIYGDGNCMSKYAQDQGNNETSGGDLITPLSVDDAKDWVELYLNDQCQRPTTKVEGFNTNPS